MHLPLGKICWFNEFSLRLKSINIRECKFTNNKGSEGSIIYVEEENVANVKLNILSSNFSNNGDDQTKYKIYSYCGEIIFDHNKIE